MFTACSPVWHDAPEDDVADHRRIDGRAAGDLAQHMGGQEDRMHVAEVAVALVAAAHRGADRFDDHDVSHGSHLNVWSGRQP